MDPVVQPPLPRTFYARDPVEVARDLLNKMVYRRSREGLVAGRIVEVEAYLADADPACHAARGRTLRNRVMFGRAGLLYVYPIHARYCLNAVTEYEHRGSAVLIRAIEPIEGIDLMAQRRGNVRLLELTRGPARLCEALQVARDLDGWDLTWGRRIWIGRELPSASPITIARSPRIGVTSAEELPLRFFADGNPFVSGPRSWHSKPARVRRRTFRKTGG